MQVLESGIFENCTSLETVNLGNGKYNSVNEKIFNGCTNLKKVSWGSNVSKIGNKAFDGCEAIEEIHSNAVNPPSCSTAFPNMVYMTCKVYVPSESVEKYQKANIWKNFWNILEEGTISLKPVIGNDANNINVYAKGNDIIIEGADVSVVTVHDFMGRQITSTTENVISNLSQGIYIVKVDGDYVFKIRI